MDQDRTTLEQRLEGLRTEVTTLEAQLTALNSERQHQLRSERSRTIYDLLVGMMLGSIGAGAALIFNVVGCVLMRLHPLQLIRVYLTFPLGEDALHIDDGPAVAIGCGLYLATGALFGMLFHAVLRRYFAGATGLIRGSVTTILGLLLWVVNYHVLLTNLQPAL